MTLAVVSGSTAREDILGALAVGVRGYIPKAIGSSELRRALATILAGNIYVPPLLASAATSGPSKDKAKRLTPRQRDVLDELVHGGSNKEIARKLGLGEGTVKIHVTALLKTLQLPNRAAAAVYGARLS